MTIRDDCITLLNLLWMLKREISVYFALRVWFGIWPYIRPSTLQKYQRREGAAWALVTGASHGIGLAFAEELLKRGFNVLIHGRNASKLETIRQRLAKEHPSQSIRILVADAAAPKIDYNAIVATVQSLPGKLTILINNVGGSPVTPSYATHEEQSEANIDELINVNLRFQTHLTSRLLPILKVNGPSVIVCCSSTAGLIGMPYVVTYSATKAFVNGFCKSLRSEMKGSKVDVHGLLIGEVDTGANGPQTQPSFLIPQPKDLVVAALNKFGCSRGMMWAYWVHAAQYEVLRWLPEGLVERMMGGVLGEKRRVEVEGLKDK